jgi:uncharacterized protein (TIGR02284 family)
MTSLEKPTQYTHDLNKLIELDLDAIEAYEAAIARLADPADRAQLQQFEEDHRRHVADLTALVQEAGGNPATSPDFKRVLTKGKVVVMGIAGDTGVLDAMKSNEETTTRAYDRARQSVDLPLQARAVIERNFSDEQRHLAWIERRAATLRELKHGAKHA